MGPEVPTPRRWLVAFMTPNQWHEAERLLVREWASGNVAKARALIRIALLEGDDATRGAALVYRGSIAEEGGAWTSAMADFQAALACFGAGSHRRYTTELSLGLAHEKLGESEAARRWYRAALTTSAAATERFSGASAAKALLAQGRQCTSGEAEVVRSVLRRAWEVLELPGEPDLRDLSTTTEILTRRASNGTA